MNPGRWPSRVGWGLASLLFLVACEGAEPPAPATPRTPGVLLLHDWYGKSPVATPSYVRTHQEFLDNGDFDGIALYLRRPDLSLNATGTVFSRTRVRHEDIARVLEPVRDLRFRHLKENFAAVVGGDPPDFMDDWSVPIANFAALAKAARDAGLRGIYFDNESYGRPWTDYPKGVSQPDKPLETYVEQARLRGRQVMEAIVAQYPDIAIILLHGPYISEPKSPSPYFPKWHFRNELSGPFFAGFVEGAGAKATVVDGGELYHLREERQFEFTREWRRTGLPSEEVNCAFLPPALRAKWSARVSAGFGVMDQTFVDLPMNPGTLATTLERALRHTDRYVWFYVEGNSFLKPAVEGGASDEWRQAVRRAREKAGTPAGR